MHRSVSGPRVLLVVVTAALAVVSGAVVLAPRGGGEPAPAPAAVGSTAGPAARAASTPPASGAPTAARHSVAARPDPADLDAAECAAGPGGKWIRVSIGRQRAWLCDGPTLTLATPVTTGADTPDRRTLTGTWQIQGKETHRWLGGPGYSVQVDYWMPYDGDFGLHDASWQTMPFGSPGWRTGGSHGCVHLPTPAMATLYAWAPVGTTITIEA